ncbi:MAG: aromatic ring-hydroxylating dioxygenase subunit alpha [Rhizobacter sp.]|nr:aromatic ring-hydroxylating dioxygenase subunit alpha [Rhizobacter sp.]
MTEHSLWHPVAASDDLADTPLAVRLLSHDLVLWRDAQGLPHVLADRCPHRGTRLSLGRVMQVDGDTRLECPYHGWQFDTGGACRAIPALPDFTPPASHAACAHEVQAAHGLLWVRLHPGPSVLPAFDAEADGALRKLLCGPYDVATSAPRLVENFLDLAHFAFVHEGWLGDRTHSALADYAIEPTPEGFVAHGCSAWQPQSNRLAAQGSQVDYRYELTGPYSAVLTKLPQAQGGYRDVIGLFVCPVDPERSRVWFRLAVTDFASSDSELRAFQDTIFQQDRPVLESQQPKCLPLSRGPDHGGEVHCAADRSSAAYRRFLRERGITFGVC